MDYLSNIANPFKPTAGKTPPLLIDRRSILEDFREGIEDGPGAPARLMRITGARGSGKTVLLTALGNIARDYGWLVIDETANDALCERILAAVRKRSLLDGADIKAQLPFVSAGIKLSAQPAGTLREALTDCAEKMTRDGKGLLITIDEVQDASPDDMREISQAVQHLIREDLSVALIFAGVTPGVLKLLEGKAMTFLRRAMVEELHPIPLDEVAEAYRETISDTGFSVDEPELSAMTEASDGYPFMIQLVGYRVFRLAKRHPERPCIEADDVEWGIKSARAEFDSAVIEVALAPITGLAMEFLLAMAEDDGASAISVIADRLEKDTKGVSPIRQRLLDEQLVVPAARGMLDYAIPHLREYLRIHSDEIRTRCGLSR